MVYRAIGLMSGSSLDGLDIAFAEFQENAGNWTWELLQAECYPYDEDWTGRLKNATTLTALDYLLLHADYGHYIGKQVNDFIAKYQLHYKVSLIASHGHTVFHVPAKKMTSQLGDGSAIAATTGLPVVSDLRALDVALGGQGAPIVPIGEKIILKEYDLFLNLGGIANISVNADPYIAFDICPANRVLNMLSNNAGRTFDDGGTMAASGSINSALLDRLNQFDYYKKPFPKSLANDFGTDTIYPMINKAGIPIPDALRTYVEHIAFQIQKAISTLDKIQHRSSQLKLLTTGGGAFNTFLVERLREGLKEQQIELVIPEAQLVNFKEALIMAFIGVLRWRQEFTVMSSVTGALRNSIGGALWTGQEA